MVTLPVVLDTDIGTDVDDLLTLIMLAGEPSVDLVAVTTVYGDVVRRAQMASHVLDLLGMRGVPVYPGKAEPMSGREVFWAGYEGDGVPGLERRPVCPTSGVDHLLRAAQQHHGELVVVAIGPLTNIAAALEREPSWRHAVRDLIVMGGEFRQRVPEWNIRCDAEAARTVLASGIRATFVGFELTSRLPFTRGTLECLCSVETPLSVLVRQQTLQQWSTFGDTDSHLHDPLAALALLEPEHFSFSSSGWRPVMTGEMLGALEPANAEPEVLFATHADLGRAYSSIVRRISRTVAGNTSGPTNDSPRP